MVSLEGIRKSIYTLTSLCTRGNPFVIKFHTKGLVYALIIELTDETYHPEPIKFVRRKHDSKRRDMYIKAATCKTCGSIEVAGICINKKCDTNMRDKPKMPVSQNDAP